jgi:hypothetical protein
MQIRIATLQCPSFCMRERQRGSKRRVPCGAAIVQFHLPTGLLRPHIRRRPRLGAGKRFCNHGDFVKCIYFGEVTVSRHYLAYGVERSSYAKEKGYKRDAGAHAEKQSLRQHRSPSSFQGL